MQTYTQAERTAIDEVHRHQLLFSAPSPSSSPIPQPTELHIALDGAGTNEIARQIHPARGGNMTATMQAAANSAGGCRIIHNHPSEHSLSSADWDGARSSFINGNDGCEQFWNNIPRESSRSGRIPMLATGNHSGRNQRFKSLEHTRRNLGWPRRLGAGRSSQ